VIATLALLFAMSGGALAASKFLITSTKQIKPSVLVQIKGKSGKEGSLGAQGPGGPQGPAGSNGKEGAPGAAGAQGPAGPKGATGAAGAAGPAGPKGAAGATGPQGPTGSAGPTGPEGSPWTAGGTLPKGQTETGTWAINQLHVTTTGIAFEPISFPIRLKTGGEAFFINRTETQEKEGPQVKASGCTGSLTEPTAPEGKLCIYTAAEEENEGKVGFIEPFNTGPEFEGAPGEYGTTGAYLQYLMEGSGASPVKITDRGIWAVRAG
jgi:hypothetical protein